MKLGTVLVLFILLAAVTHAFKMNEPIRSLDSVDLNITNNTRDITFGLASLEGNAEWPLPGGILPPNGGSNLLRLEIDAFRNDLFGRYLAFRMDAFIGEFEFRFRCDNLGLRFNTFKVLFNSAPIVIGGNSPTDIIITDKPAFR
ncbi:hypothetical protein M3223_21120 [Paenibacillus pasadenensis]|uniref:hypothetical protein n=1 Tax=Paenibacillus pasadenensis TaxID=217090 RepID=UPI00203A6940|nr:hypothetical protein [Paenibacillus pasadenensis]MCM3749838.1 hypothetical protein [Paenibacillus pasadenensis]